MGNERLSPVIAELLGGASMVCNTLNLEYGSQQQSHQGTLYMPSRVPNKMVASWIALEPATGGSAIAERGSTRKALVAHYFRRKDYLHRLWKIRKHQPGAYYYAKRPDIA